MNFITDSATILVAISLVPFVLGCMAWLAVKGFDVMDNFHYRIVIARSKRK